MAFQFQSVREILCLFSKILPYSPACSLLHSTISLHWWLAANLSIISQFSFKLDEQTGLSSAYISFFPPFVFHLKFRLDKWLHYCCGQIFYVSFCSESWSYAKGLEETVAIAERSVLLRWFDGEGSITSCCRTSLTLQLSVLYWWVSWIESLYFKPSWVSG